MQKINIETITATRNNVAGVKTIMVRREVLPSEQQSTSRKRTSFLGSSQFERTGRVAMFNMSDADIAKFGIAVGKDLNECVAAELGEQAVQVLESTDKNEFGEDIALGMDVKLNPSTDTPVTHKGQTIYHTTILTSAKYFAEDGGDITLAIDQQA